MRTTMSCLALLGMCIAAQPAEAQTSAAYPTAPVRLVVGFPPGGPTDIMARLFASNLAEGLNGNFVVDNRPGAGSTIATDLVAKAKPDGYTLLVATLGGQGISPSMYRNLPYDPVKDFAPVCQLASVPNVLVVHPGVPVKSVQELIAYAKERPGELNYANTGSGTSQHMAMELFKHMTGLNIVAVNYRGSTPAIVDLIAGRSQMMIDNTSALGPHIHAGKLRALAVSSRSRVPAFPDLPTMDEAGVPGYEIVSWFGLMAPAGTPREIVDKIAGACLRIADSPEFVRRLAELGATPAGSTSDQFDAKVRAEIAKWGTIIRAAGVKVE